MSPDSGRTSQSCTKGKPEEDGALPEGLPDLQHRPEERSGHQDRLHPRPHPPRILSCQWLSSVFCQDMLSRLEEVKAAITSVYGRILKVDSTKKVAKKLQGSAVGHQCGERARPGAIVYSDYRRGCWTGLHVQRSSPRSPARAVGPTRTPTPTVTPESRTPTKDSPTQCPEGGVSVPQEEENVSRAQLPFNVVYMH